MHYRNKINFSKDNIARGLCTLVPFIISFAILRIDLVLYNIIFFTYKFFLFAGGCGCGQCIVEVMDELTQLVAQTQSLTHQSQNNL